MRCISPLAAIRSQRGTSDAVFRARAGFYPAMLGCPSNVGMAPDNAAIGRLQHGRDNSTVTRAALGKSS